MSIDEDEMEDITVKFRLTGEKCPSVDVRDDMGIGPPQRNRLNSANSRSDEEIPSEEENSDDSHQDFNKPLMYPRQRAKVTVQNIHRKNPWRRCLWAVVYLFIFSAAILASVFLVIYFVNSYTNKLLLEEFKEQWTEGLTALPCTDINVEDVWVRGFPKVLTESAFRLVHVNKDSVLDVIMGFATGGDKLRAELLVCDIYFNGSKPCGGGVMALDGKTGAELWRTYSLHEIFSLNCNADLDGDKILDCIGGGRAGTFMAVSSATGQLLWTFNDTSLNDVMNLYTGQFIGDMDKDGVEDVLNIHGGDPLGEPGSNTRLPGKIMFFSGRTGKVLRWSYVPDMRESYFSPVLYNNSRGLNVLFGTGGETHPGALWCVPLKELWHGRIDKALRIYTDPFKGIMTPPALVDITEDGTEDIVFAAYNSTVLAINGETYGQIWNYSFPSSETYASPAPGFYNNDSIPDFLVRWQYGPGFPIYYHSVMTVLDGKTGKPLLNPYPRDSVGAQSSPLTISMEHQGSNEGQDLFLYWIADCMFHEGEGGQYTFQQGTNVHEQSRSDFCKLRFKSDGYSQLLALGKDFELPGKPLYTSWKREKEERSAWVNTTQESLEFLKNHPEHMTRFLQLQTMIEEQKDAWRRSDVEKETGKDKISTYSRYEDLRGSDYTESEDPRLPEINRGSNYDHVRLNAGQYNQVKDYGRPGSDRYRLSQANYLAREKQYKPSPSSRFAYNNAYGYKGNSYDSYDDTDGRYSNAYSKGSYNPLSKLMTALEDKTSIDSSLDPAYKDARYRNVPLSSPYDKIKDISQSRNNYDYRRLANAQQRIGYRPYRLAVSNLKERDVPLDKQGEAMSKGSAPHEKNAKKPKRTRKRIKRHLGPHDEGGLQRLISTGTLAPTLLPPAHKDHKHSIDIVFATYWFYPAKTDVLLPEDEKCITDKMAKETQRFDPDSHYYGMDHDGYQHVVQHECLEESGHQMPEDKTYESQTTSTAYNLHMGQMTVYRLRLTCRCGDEKSLLKQRKRCLRILPFEKQQWPSYMGPFGTGHWRSNDPSDTNAHS